VQRGDWGRRWRLQEVAKIIMRKGTMIKKRGFPRREFLLLSLLLLLLSSSFTLEHGFPHIFTVSGFLKFLD
jgi:hypothetical protein